MNDSQPIAIDPPSRPLKLPRSISIYQEIDHIISVEWVDAQDRNHVVRRPSPGSVVTEMVAVLKAAGWQPGDGVKTVKAKKTKGAAGFDAAQPPHQITKAGK